MPLLELEKAGLEAVMKIEVDNITDQIQSKRKYVRNILDHSTEQFHTHYARLRYLEGVAKGMRETLAILRKHL